MGTLFLVITSFVSNTKWASSIVSQDKVLIGVEIRVFQYKRAGWLVEEGKDVETLPWKYAETCGLCM